MPGTQKPLRGELSGRRICERSVLWRKDTAIFPGLHQGDTIYCRLCDLFSQICPHGGRRQYTRHAQTCLSNIERRWETWLKHAHTLRGASPLSCSNKESCRFVVWPPYIVKIRTTVVLIWFSLTFRSTLLAHVVPLGFCDHHSLRRLESHLERRQSEGRMALLEEAVCH